jgi:hydrogenase-1 operon protein HyaE
MAQHLTKHGCTEVGADNFEVFSQQGARTLLVFTEDPIRVKETLDLAVIVPEIVHAFPGAFAVGVLLPEAARAFQPRYGFRRWPALVVLQGGQYVGAVDGLRGWDEYMSEVARLISAPPTRPPTLGIPVRGEGDGSGACST